MAKDFQIVVDEMTFNMQMPDDPTTEELAYFQRERAMAEANLGNDAPDGAQRLIVGYLGRSMRFEQYLRFCDQMIAKVKEQMEANAA